MNHYSAASPKQAPNDPTRVSDQYRMVVLQPTTLCNLDCGYCYLALRHERRDMHPGIAAAVAADIALQDAEHRVTVLWHGGEPTTVGVDTMRRLLAPFEPLRAAGRIQHSIQTNATLINDAWINLFKEYEFNIGISIDGPADINSARLNLAGRPAFNQILAGILKLKNAGLSLSAIAVITPQTVSRASEIIEFLGSLGVERMAFNLEEREGVNTERPMVEDREAIQFWREAVTYFRRHPDAPNPRELGTLSRYLRPGGEPVRDVLPTIAYNGDVVLLSPELSTLHAPEYGDFVVGNVRHETIQHVLTRHHEIPYVAEFERGLAECAATCPFWTTCYGGYASNRYAERGRLDISETAWCRGAHQALVRAVIEMAHPEHDGQLIQTITERTGGLVHA